MIGTIDHLSDYPVFKAEIRHASDHGYSLMPAQTENAFFNALRYIPPVFHESLVPEFMNELRKGLPNIPDE